MLAAWHVLKRLLPMYLLMVVCVLAVQLVYFDNLVWKIKVYGGPTASKSGLAGDELAKVLKQDFNKEAAFYRWWKTFDSEAGSPDATPTSAARLGKLVKEPTALVIIQDGYRPNFSDLWDRHQPGMTAELATVHSVDVRAIADLWDSYLHVVVAADQAGVPRVPSIDHIKPDWPIYIGRGAQAALSRKVLCKYGVFASDDEAKKALDKVPDPANPSLQLQSEEIGEAIDAVRDGRIQVAFLLTSSVDMHEKLAAKRAGQQGGIQILPIDRAEAIVEEATFGEPARLPWSLYQDWHAGAANEQPPSLPTSPASPPAGDPEWAKGLKTIRTQTILAGTSHLADGVVATILHVLYARTDFKQLRLLPRPATDQKFLFPMHDAAYAFHKGGPAPGFITSPFIVGGLALILGQLLHISGQLRERKGRLRDRQGRLREQESGRFIAELHDLLAPSSETGTSREDVALGEIHRRAVLDFASGRITRDGYERIKEFHRLLRRLLGRRDGD